MTRNSQKWIGSFLSSAEKPVSIALGASAITLLIARGVVEITSAGTSPQKTLDALIFSLASLLFLFAGALSLHKNKPLVGALQLLVGVGWAAVVISHLLN